MPLLAEAKEEKALCRKESKDALGTIGGDIGTFVRIDARAIELAMLPPSGGEDQTSVSCEEQDVKEASDADAKKASLETMVDRWTSLLNAGRHEVRREYSIQGLKDFFMRLDVFGLLPTGLGSDCVIVLRDQRLRSCKCCSTRLDIDILDNTFGQLKSVTL